jgi:NifU-like protein involved in Fe-S cluster formation
MAAAMNQPLYTVEILRLAATIPCLGRLEDAHGRAEVRSATCGSVVSVEVTLDKAMRVAGLAQQVQACAFGQASAALMGRHAIGRSITDVRDALADLTAWLDGTRDDPGGWPGLGDLMPARTRRARQGALLLPFRGLLAAVEDALERRDG